MRFTPLTESQRQGGLGLVFRTVRLHRRLRIHEVANAIGVCRRTYENIEAGRGRVEVEQLYKFATVTRSDVYSLLAAIDIASPEWAVSTLETKTMMVAVCALAGLDATLGDDVRKLDQSRLIYEMNGVCERMAECARQGVDGVNDLLQGLADLKLNLRRQETRAPLSVTDEE